MTSPYARMSWTRTEEALGRNPMVVGNGSGGIVTEDYGFATEGPEEETGSLYGDDASYDSVSGSEDEWSGVGSVTGEVKKRRPRSDRHVYARDSNAPFNVGFYRDNAQKMWSKAKEEMPESTQDAYQKFSKMGIAHKALFIKVLMFTSMFLMVMGLIVGKDIAKEVEIEVDHLESSDFLRGSKDDASSTGASRDDPHYVAPWEEPKEKGGEKDEISSPFQKAISDLSNSGSDSEDELPDGWTKYTDPESGEPYYADADGKTTWDRPSPIVPDSWTQYTDPESGKPYYADEDGKTTWTLPTTTTSEEGISNSGSEEEESTSLSSSSSDISSNNESIPSESETEDKAKGERVGRSGYKDNEKDEVQTAEDEDSTTSSSSSTSSSAKEEVSPSVSDDLESEQDVHEGWSAATDPATGDTYYYNMETKETTWELPQPSSPTLSFKGGTSESLRAGHTEVLESAESESEASSSSSSSSSSSPSSESASASASASESESKSSDEEETAEEQAEVLDSPESNPSSTSSSASQSQSGSNDEEETVEENAETAAATNTESENNSTSASDEEEYDDGDTSASASSSSEGDDAE